MLDLGVRPDVINSHSRLSGLHAAVVSSPDAIDRMLRYCKDPDLPKLLGGTPLFYVIHQLGELPGAERREKLLSALQSLLAAGANPRAGDSDQTALELVRLYRLDDIEALLIGYLKLPKFGVGLHTRPMAA